ncbi:MAG: efflux RND transporter permease subunit [Rhodobacter sp.]|nr:efflux RND transporter permease subunit [Rhodobacter sp.]MCA3493251.1 efflux RND transporter permease subunit [Rhodobacter sp.]MCA3499999.1 efflux RND transporter permease subunit [Rhodobacter sp.]MCA3505008.1 efflux RND transporter permease subunit [Rhodobacter sp.]MCA3517238.1 efflux RND transporter permease subunit [Rhodobacter sp.]
MDTLFFRQPRLVILTLMIILSAGLSSLVSIGRQEDPTITNIFATITTVFPGADPARVEALVTAKIETQLRTIPEIAEVSSTSATAISVVSVELVETVPPDMIEQLWAQVRDAVDEAQRDFPPGVLEPDFNSDGAGGYAAIFALTLPDGFSLTRAAREAEALADALRRVPGTSLVDLHGLPEEEVLVTLHPDRIAALGLTADAVSDAIRAADAKVQAGRLRGDETDLVLGITGEITSLDRLRAVVLREDAGGRVTLLGDVADITRGPRLPLAEAALFQGQPAILVSAQLGEGLQVDRWMTDVRAAVAAQASDLPWGLAVETVFDQSRYTAERLSAVGVNMAQGVVLVVIVLFVTLGWRAALIVAMVLPVVTLASLATLNALGVPIHQMSVTGLIVALGLLVDAAIVMTDEVGQRLRAGLSRLEAVGKSVRRLTMPLLASTVTTILSFLPLLLLPGPSGDFVGSIATAVIVMLVWSFVVAIAITPALSGLWLRQGDGAPAYPGLTMRIFRALLTLSMANPVRTVALSLVLPVLGFLSLPLLTPQFFPGVDRDQFHIEVDLPPGTGIAETLRLVNEIDATLAAEEGIADVAWVVGRSAPAFYYNMVGDRDQAPAYAQGLIRTDSPAATDRLLARLQASLPPRFTQVRFVIRGLTQGPPVNAPVELRLVGQDIDALRQAGDQLRAYLARVSSVAMVRTGIAGGAPKLTLAVDEARARLLGLDLGQVARQMEAGLEGVTGGSLLEGTEELPVRVRLGAGLRGDPVAIGDMPILPPGAAQIAATGAFPAVPLSTLGTLRLEPSESTINRLNGERVNDVQAYLMPGVLPAVALAEAMALMEAEGYAPPQGIRLQIGGDSDERDSTVQALVAPLGLIITLSIAIVVLTFNSFRLTLIAFAVAGLSAGLSILSLAVFSYPFGINAIIGVIGSIGVSINAALIVLSALQEDARASAGDRAAMVDVVAGSSRHIVSTTVTTVGGFLPLILGGGGFWPPFAMSIAGGVALSVILAFAFTPQMFALTLPRRRAVPMAVAAG